MKKLVKIIFFISWFISTILISYMLYITIQTTYNYLELWAYISMYALSFIGSSILTYNIMFLSHSK